MNSKRLSTKEYIHHLENEEKRCSIRALVSDDPAERLKHKEKEKRTKELRSKLQKLWGGVNVTAFRISAQNDRVR